MHFPDVGTRDPDGVALVLAGLRRPPPTFSRRRGISARFPLCEIIQSLPWHRWQVCPNPCRDTGGAKAANAITQGASLALHFRGAGLAITHRGPGEEALHVRSALLAGKDGHPVAILQRSIAMGHV